MEKLEKHIKQKLESREIKPSKKAWSKLEERLETPSKQSNNLKWYAIAAVFIGILMVTSIYFNGNEEQQQPQVVIEDDQNDDNEAEKNPINTAKEKPSIAEIEENTSPQIDEKKFTEPKTKTVNALSETVQEKMPFESRLAENQQLVIDKKVDEVLAKITLLKSQDQSVTEAEVDSLLRAAQKEVLADKLFDQNGSVDAMALLAEVEDELNDSFRDQIFEALKEGYTKLRTAVADRNN